MPSYGQIDHDYGLKLATTEPDARTSFLTESLERDGDITYVPWERMLDHVMITDELYLFPVFEADVVPLMRSRFDFDAANFFSADLAIRGQRNSNAGWNHPRGSSLVAWVHSVAASPIRAAEGLKLTLLHHRACGPSHP